MTPVANTRAVVILVIGDLVTFVFSLILTLSIRYRIIPDRTLIVTHLSAFVVLFAIFLMVNLAAGLYDKQFAQVRGRLQGMIVKAQIANAIIGVLFFYFSASSIAPKINLFIFFVVSTALMFLWRVVVFPVVTVTRRQVAVIVGAGDDIDDLYSEINGNPRYGLVFKDKIVPMATITETASAISESLKRFGAYVVVDLHDKMVESSVPLLYTMIFSGVQIIDAGKLYETIFDRIPLGLLSERWLVENSSTALGNRRVYDSIKRLIDVAVSLVGGAISLIFYPFVYVAIKLDDGGPIFIRQERVGRNGNNIEIVKFRSMSRNDDGDYADGNGRSVNKVTRVGSFLRRSRIDELPQFWNVLKGDLSMVGPRPELPRLTEVYEKEISFYNIRHLVKPGLFGWAQIYHESHPHHSVDTKETKNKLCYDLYYIKNRSLALDLRIIIRTINILLRQAGR